MKPERVDMVGLARSLCSGMADAASSATTRCTEVYDTVPTVRCEGPAGHRGAHFGRRGGLDVRWLPAAGPKLALKVEHADPERTKFDSRRNKFAADAERLKVVLRGAVNANTEGDHKRCDEMLEAVRVFTRILTVANEEEYVELHGRTLAGNCSRCGYDPCSCQGDPDVQF